MQQIRSFARLLRTVRYLKPVQFYGRIWFRCYRPQPNLRPAPALRSVSGSWITPTAKNQSLLEPWRFCFLGKEQTLKGAADWNNSDWEKLWLYNLHYFDDLNSASADLRMKWHRQLLCSWVEENPPGIGNGWEPYPSSLRIVNIVKWGLVGNSLPGEVVQSLAVQVRYLSKRLEYHLLGNHLFANAKALIFAGLFFEGAEAQGWLCKGLQILTTEIPEQMLEDGGHFECSPMYHAIILEDLLDLINLLRGYGQTLSQAWVTTAEKMLFWLRGMTHPDGEIAFFNDAAFGIAPQPAQLFAYAERLGLNGEWNDRLVNGLTHFESSGYLRWQNGDVVALLDVAKVGPDYLPGHAHADTLSFELSLYGQRLFVNSGTSCYGTSDERLRQRSTSAHNTVEVDGANSSEVWGGFRVARRARPFDLRIDELPELQRITCSHDGYRRLPGKPVHRRCWEFRDESLTIVDSIIGPFENAVVRYHFHPDCQIEIYESGQIHIELSGGRSLDLHIKGGKGSLVDTTYHPEFGLSLPNKCLEIMFAKNTVTTSMNWY